MTPRRDLPLLAACVILALVFLAAAVPKIADPAAFALAIYRYQLAPSAAINALAILFPWTELVAAIALLIGPRLRRGALLVLLILLAVFTAAISINLYRGVDIACGCFSVKASDGHLGALNLARNAALFALATWALHRTRPERAP